MAIESGLVCAHARHVRVCTRVYACTCTRARVRVCVYVCACVRVRARVCVYAHVYAHFFPLNTTAIPWKDIRRGPLALKQLQERESKERENRLVVTQTHPVLTLTFFPSQIVAFGKAFAEKGRSRLSSSSSPEYFISQTPLSQS